jgi:hypothetical protein
VEFLSPSKTIRMKLKFTMAIVAFSFMLTTDVTQAQSNKKSTACDLRTDMRKLWEDHVQWTRNVIFNILDDLPGAAQDVARLLKNQEDIGNAIKPYYGDEAGNQLTSLLRNHILIAADLLVALKNDNTAAFNTANAKWFANADSIAAFLSSANPNWPLAQMKEMMYTHLNLTAAEALARKQHNYDADVTAYDNVHNEILQMADMLTEGIVKQFSNKFSGCPIKENTEQSKPTECDLKTGMRKLWEDHITWTRNVIFNIIDNLPGTTQAVNRLLQNQVDIGNAIKPYYGDAAGNHLTALLHDHITIAAALLVALKNNDAPALAAANTQWYANADSIARFLSSANPAWPYADMKSMMFMHLDLTTAEAVARKNADYAGDVVAYDNVTNEILKMADMLTAGIVQQFRNQFSGCPITTPSVKPVVTLRQNVPNPFMDQTVISFFIPQSVNKAQLTIYDHTGNAVRTFNLTQRGEGSVTFNASNLRHGLYTYSIVADGIPSESKKMVR